MQLMQNSSSEPIQMSSKANGGGNNNRHDREDSKAESAETDEQKKERLIKQYEAMIKEARGKGYAVAADNLQHFLDGSGTLRILDDSWLRGFDSVQEALKRNQDRFEKQLIEKANVLADGQEFVLEDYWDAQETASIFSELYYASGTFTVTSNGIFRLKRTGKSITITGEVDIKWQDPYDWHEGLSAYIPGFGDISDEDALFLQKYGKAKPFKMESYWKYDASGNIKIRDYWFAKEEFSWTLKK